MHKKLLTVLTPTYNRSKELVKLYNSLCNQSNYNFVWLIIDDGSVDNTKEIISNFCNKNFNIIYKYKKNGGKHTALNYGFKFINTELVMIVDSDDYLENNAVSQIYKDWQKYKKNKSICGLVYVRKYPNGKYICDNFNKKEIISNYNSFVINSNIKGDKAEVFKSEILCEYKFPEFKGEKFVGEGVIWSKISKKYDMVFIDKAIYVCDYLEGGLTKSGRKMRLKSPNGGMFHAEEYLDKIYNNKVRIKNAILYIVYSKYAKISFRQVLNRSEYKTLLLLCFLPAILLYTIWRFKYS